MLDFTAEESMEYSIYNDSSWRQHTTSELIGRANDTNITNVIKINYLQ